MFNFLRKPKGTGLLPDIRPAEEKAKDYTADEVLIFKAINWTEKSQSEWRRFEPVQNQSQSGSCVGQSVALSLGIENSLEENKFVSLSARFIYAQGYEQGGGMYYAKALDIAKKQGCPPEQLLPSQNLGEDKMRVFDAKVSDNQVALVYKPNGYVYLPINFDAIAQILDLGKPVLLGTRFNSGGFTAEVKLDPNGQYGHAIVCVDRTFWKGQKALIFQNSWGNSYGFGGLGIITEDQKAGLVVAVYFEDLSNNWRDEKLVKPKWNFSKNLKFGDKNQDVGRLQDCLRFDGEFPTIPSTSYFGSITKKAVIQFQGKYGIIPVSGFVGPITRAKLNKLFS